MNWFTDNVQIGIFVAGLEIWIKINENLLNMWVITCIIN